MTFGIVPGAYSVLAWAPLLAMFSGLVAWLAVLVVLQRRSRVEGRSSRPVARPNWRPVALTAAWSLAVVGALTLSGLAQKLGVPPDATVADSRGTPERP